MRRKRLWIAALALAVGMVAGGAVWLGNQSPLERYTSPPLRGTKYRVSLLVPKGWILDKNVSAGRDGEVMLEPQRPPAWIPGWLRRGPFRDPDVEEGLYVAVTPYGVANVVYDQEVDKTMQDRYCSSQYYPRLMSALGLYRIIYSRSTKQDFLSTRLAIYNSLRLVE